MNTTNGISETNTGAATLDETTFGAAEVGRSYLTSRGHEVLVVEVVPGSHAIVQSRKGKEMRVAADQVAHGPLPAVQPETEEVEAPVVVAAAKTVRAPRERDPRLPPVGTTITKRWKRGGQEHLVVAVELLDGTFTVSMDDQDLGPAKSLSGAAELALRHEGITSPMNGFAWFRVGRPDATPRPRKERSVEDLAAQVARIEGMFTKAVERAAHLEAELEAARKDLAEARAAEVAPTPVAD